MKQNKLVDIDKIFKTKLAKVYNWVPSFIIKLIAKILHEKDINNTLSQLQGLEGLAFNKRALEIMNVSIESKNIDRVPLSESIIMVANHPLGGLDGMAFIKVVGDLRSDVKFCVNDMLKQIKQYGDIFVPLNKLGSTSATNMRLVEEVFRKKSALLFFPAGLVSRKRANGVIGDLEWKKGFVTQAVDHQRMVLPVFIEGQNSRFFYNFARWRKKLGIKTNIEMILLPHEMFKAKKKNIVLHFGKPFSSSVLDDTKNHKAWAKCLKEYIYSSAFKNDVPFETYCKI